MRRRTLLRRGGTLSTGALALSLAGCTGPASGPAAGDGDDGDTPTEADQRGDGPVSDVGIETTSTACASGLHSTADVAFDEDDATVTITGTLTASTPCHRAVFESVSDDGDDTLVVVLGTEPDDQDGCVECVGAISFEGQIVFEDRVPETVTVRQSDVQLASVERGDGETADGDDEVTDTSFEIVETTSAGPGETADVRFHDDENRVSFTGTIHGSNGCTTAALDDVSYDAETDQVTLSVRTHGREGTDDQLCTQQILAISYEATVTLDGVTPKGAAVLHDDRSVMSAAHGSASASAPTDGSDPETPGTDPAGTETATTDV